MSTRIARRETTHLAVETQDGGFYLVSSLSTRNDTQLIEVDPATGDLLYIARPDVDLFPDEAAALLHVTNCISPIISTVRGYALLGMVIIDAMAYIALATKIRRDLLLNAVHNVYTVVEVEWIKIRLWYPHRTLELHQTNAKLLRQFPLGGLHFYCETFDLTRPFPSTHPVHRYDPTFCWNDSLAEPFTVIGMREWCVVLLQGLAIGRPITYDATESISVVPQQQQQHPVSAGFHRKRSFSTTATSQHSTAARSASNSNTSANSSNSLAPEAPTPKSEPVKRKEKVVHLCMITRKSCVNPGTRYEARGLNDRGGPGNECESELIMWRGGTQVDFCSFVWRRGTVPLWWQTQIKNKVGEVEISIREKDTYEYSDKYYAGLLERFGPHPITLVNLLKSVPNQKELLLSEQFERSIEYVKSLVNIDIRLNHFDWHTKLKEMGAASAIQGLWALLRPAISGDARSSGTGITCGTISMALVQESEQQAPESDTTSDLDAFTAAVASNTDIVHSGRAFALTSQSYCSRQTGIVRFNCADSLDRTNVANFFLAFQIMAEMCIRLGIDPRKPSKRTPELWQEWKFFEYSIEELNATLLRSFIEPLAEFFVHNGDIISILYTNSPAMHSALMRQFSPNVASAPINAFVAVQRRFQNVVHDGVRQMQYEMLLGLHKDRHFPGLVDRVKCLSRYPAKSVYSMDSLLPSQHADSLLTGNDMFCWIAPNGQTRVELIAYLPQPSHVKEIALTINHGISTDMYPHRFDCFVGTYCNTTRVVFQNVRIPRCSNGTKLVFPIAPTPSMRSSTLYDFYGQDADPRLQHLVRVVHLVLHDVPEGHNISIGKVEVFGYIATPPISPHASWTQYKQAQAEHHVSSIIHKIAGVSLPPSSEGDLEMLVNYSIAEPAPPPDLRYDDSDTSSTTTSHDGTSSTPALSNSSTDGSEGGAEEDTTARLRAPSSLELVAGSSEPPPPPSEVQDESDTQFQRLKVEAPKIVPESHREHHDTDAAAATSFDSPFDTENDVLVQYRQLVLSKLQESEETGLAFLDTLELEYFRRMMMITPRQRDTVLVTLDLVIEDLNPSRFVFLRNETTELARRKSNTWKTSNCSKCGSSLRFARAFQCFYCYRRHCTRCMSANSVEIFEFKWTTKHPVCIKCEQIIKRQRELLEKIKQLEDPPGSSFNAAEDAQREKLLLQVNRMWQIETKLHYHSKVSQAKSVDGPSGAVTITTSSTTMTTLPPPSLGSSYLSTPPNISKFSLMSRDEDEMPQRRHGRQGDSDTAESSDDLLRASRDEAYDDTPPSASLARESSSGSEWDSEPRSINRPPSSTSDYLLNMSGGGAGGGGGGGGDPIPNDIPSDSEGDDMGISGIGGYASRRNDANRRVDSGIEDSVHGPMESSLVADEIVSAPLVPILTALTAYDNVRPVSNYPRAGILNSVPTKLKAAPVESILFPPHTIPLKRFWSAPAGLSSVSITIVLECYARVSTLILLADPVGYSIHDAPLISIAAGHMFNMLQPVGRWKVKPMRGTDSLDTTGCSEYHFSAPLECRIICLQLALPHIAGLSGTVNDMRALHMGRIRVLGEPIHRDFPGSPFSSLQFSDAEQYRIYQEALKAAKPVPRRLISQTWSKHRNEKKVLDIGPIQPCTIKGFNIVIRHTNEGISSQVRVIRVSGVVTGPEKSVLSMQLLGKYIIPKTQPNAKLSYDFDVPSNHNILTFEFLTSYGAKDVGICSISLYN